MPLVLLTVRPQPAATERSALAPSASRDQVTASNHRWWLEDNVSISVEYDDNTAFGSPMTDRPVRTVRELFAPVFSHVERRGFADLLTAAPSLVAEVAAGDAFASVAERVGEGWRLRPEFLYPAFEQCRPRWLTFASPKRPAFTVDVPRAAWPELHALIADLTYRGHVPDDRNKHPDIKSLFEGLREASLLHEGPDQGVEPMRHDLTFVGHNTVVVRSSQAAVVVDPFFFAHTLDHPSYQPLGPRQLGEFDAVLVTHSHPDHFDPASLLRLPPDVQIVVPALEQETVLGSDMQRRLLELGFRRVCTLGWGESVTIKDIKVHALPFLGEQPGDGRVLHPEVRNHGNTYVVTTPTTSAAFLADSGRDDRGDVRDVAERWRSMHPPVDVVFAGYRGWATYPVQLLFSSVAAFALFIPPELWATRHRLMTDATDAIDVAERFGARHLVPYADGGAPWHWAIGLGPRLDGTGTEDPDFDPFPERVAETARQRVCVPGGPTLASPVNVLQCRPGDSIDDPAGQARLTRIPGHSWPFDSL